MLRRAKASLARPDPKSRASALLLSGRRPHQGRFDVQENALHPARPGSFPQRTFLSLSRGWATSICVSTILLAGSACSFGTTPEGFLGDERLVYFQPSSEQVFSQRLMTGSRFWLNVAARREDDEARVLAARLRPSDEAILRIHRAAEQVVYPDDAGPTPVVLSDGGPDAAGDAGGDAQVAVPPPAAEDAGVAEESGVGPALPAGTARRYWVEVLAPGAAQLILEDDEGGIDQITLQAADAQRIDLLDLNILGNDLDARLPNRFALVTELRQELAIAAEDRCGGPLLALDAIEFRSTAPSVCEAQRESALSYTVSALSEGEVDMTPIPHVASAILGGTEPFSLSVHAPEDIDSLRLEVAAVEGSTALVWGRSFASGTEVIGLEYDWDASERVDLDRSRGFWVNATLYIPQEEEAPDDRPAEVFASWQNRREAEIDLLTVRENEVNRSRLPPLTPENVNTSASCAGDPCDPVGASVFGAWFCLRRKRRKQKAAHRK